MLPWLHAGNDPREPATLDRDPRAIEAGSFMPDYGLSAEQLDQVVAYLTTLE